MRASREDTKEKSLSQLDSFIKSGAWLFQKSTGGQEHLAGLYKHSGIFDRKRTRLFWANLLSASEEEEVDEDGNQRLESIICIFPNQEDKA